jgi:branched-chain amino acid transport system permease protein
MSRLFAYGGFTVLALCVAGLVAAPFLLKPYGIYLLSMWAVITIAALGLNLTLGYAGQVSLAQGAFVGIGAYTVALLGQQGWSYPLCFLLAGALCFGIGWILGYPALRVQHHYLAFVTLAFSTLVFLFFRNEQWLTNGIYGVSGIARPSLLGWSTAKSGAFYAFTMGMLLVFTLAVGGIVRSPWGRAFKALRENPVRALSLGVDTRRYTLMAFALGSALGGFAGALYAPLVQFIEPVSFALGLSLNLLLMVIVGGAGLFFGPFLGALIAILLPEWLRFTSGYYLICYAIMVMVLMTFCPTGLLGLVDRVIAARRTRLASAARSAIAASLEEGSVR